MSQFVRPGIVFPGDVIRGNATALTMKEEKQFHQQRGRVRFLGRVVALTTIWPNLSLVKLDAMVVQLVGPFDVSPGHPQRGALVCLGAGTDLHGGVRGGVPGRSIPLSVGGTANSPWYASEVRYIWRSTSMLSLSVSVCSSAVLEGSPHTCCSLRPLTGLGALGLGNHAEDAPSATVGAAPNEEEETRSSQGAQMVP